MKAIVYNRYGSPDVLQLQEREIPTPGPNEVLVKVCAASLNPLDWHLLRGEPRLLRLMGFGIFRPKDGRLGADIAGRVEAVGEGVQQFQPGLGVGTPFFPLHSRLPLPTPPLPFSAEARVGRESRGKSGTLFFCPPPLPTRFPLALLTFVLQCPPV